MSAYFIISFLHDDLQQDEFLVWFAYGVRPSVVRPSVFRPLRLSRRELHALPLASVVLRGAVSKQPVPARLSDERPGGGARLQGGVALRLVEVFLLQQRVPDEGGRRRSKVPYST